MDRQRVAESGRWTRARPVRLWLRISGRGGFELAAGVYPGLPCAARFRAWLSALVPPLDGDGRDPGERVSFPDATARDAIRMAPAWRARCVAGSRGNPAGRPGHLSGDAARAELGACPSPLRREQRAYRYVRVARSNRHHGSGASLGSKVDPRSGARKKTK